MSRFDYYEPKSVKEALDLLKQFGQEGKITAGATDVLVQISRKKIHPKYLINISKIEELHYIQKKGDGIVIGPLMTMRDIIDSQLAKEELPALHQAALSAAGPQVRNIGTIGGNLGTGSPAGDFLPPLMAYDAKIKLASAKTERVVSMAELLVGPQKTCIGSDEMIVEIMVPKATGKNGSAFIKMGKRKSLSVSIVNNASFVELAEDKKTVKNVRIALGSVAATVVRSASAEKYLVGKQFTAEEIEKASNLVAGDISPITDARAVGKYRKEVACVLVKRTLSQILEAFN